MQNPKISELWLSHSCHEAVSFYKYLPHRKLSIRIILVITRNVITSLDEAQMSPNTIYSHGRQDTETDSSKCKDQWMMRLWLRGCPCNVMKDPSDSPDVITGAVSLFYRRSIWSIEVEFLNLVSGLFWNFNRLVWFLTLFPLYFFGFWENSPVLCVLELQLKVYSNLCRSLAVRQSFISSSSFSASAQLVYQILAALTVLFKITFYTTFPKIHTPYTFMHIFYTATRVYGE
jgi:hypothetical protein